ncbi:MAG: methylenetetrahydrofolate--tRNA-(uracil(54)-C(5))-methyltransferase (FADH(2)-oxidizing) TrmFO, partial [Acutalibacteraceae bacterium]|nr:methylenetetrahydrofolate--tRNA-(uracil(54)-C(5))-methyltransferase (FADH(2)-oxidizing) TrmFO [Acutalibacteraceae bacterium]
AAQSCSVPAGGALAVDRYAFSDFISNRIKSHPGIEIVSRIVEKIPKDAPCIIATGPLTDGALADEIKKYCGSEGLSFYDAAAPIVTAESIDMSVAFRASRYDKGDADYINCPMNKEEYEAFHTALVGAESAELHSFDKNINVYEGCMPVEILAKRGVDSIRFGPLKPVGLRDPRTGNRPWAVVQLRSENSEGTLYNLVGFQTNLKFGEQKRVFSMIPGLQNAEFMRYGVMHRNSFIDSPRLLNNNLSLKANNNIFFAGQITGVEGYMESAACGIIAAENMIRHLKGESALKLPEFTMLGALIRYITNPDVVDFQPMGANFGIIPPLETRIRDKAERYTALSQRSLKWYDENFIN